MTDIGRSCAKTRARRSCGAGACVERLANTSIRTMSRDSTWRAQIHLVAFRRPHVFTQPQATTILGAVPQPGLDFTEVRRLRLRKVCLATPYPDQTARRALSDWSSFGKNNSIFMSSSSRSSGVPNCAMIAKSDSLIVPER